MSNYVQSKLVSKFFKKGIPLYFRKGDLILGIEPTPNGVYFIDTGYVKVYSITDSGEQLVHIIYGHGEIFPLVWAYLDEHTNFYFEALAETLAWRISRSQFTAFIKTDKPGSYDIARQMAQQFNIYSDRLDNLEYKKSGERLAYRLLFLAGRFGIRKGRNILIDTPITHELMANSINLVRESVSREFMILEKLNIIERVDHRILIKDIKRLRQQLSEPTGLKFWGLD